MSIYEPTDANFSGHTVVGKTAYRVHMLPAKLDCGIVGRYWLIGPRGSAYYVTDYGPRYELNSVCMGGGVAWKASPRPLRGLGREHLSLFESARLEGQ